MFLYHINWPGKSGHLVNLDTFCWSQGVHNTHTLHRFHLAITYGCIVAVYNHLDFGWIQLVRYTIHACYHMVPCEQMLRVTVTNYFLVFNWSDSTWWQATVCILNYMAMHVVISCLTAVWTLQLLIVKDILIPPVLIGADKASNGINFHVHALARDNTILSTLVTAYTASPTVIY